MSFKITKKEALSLTWQHFSGHMGDPSLWALVLGNFLSIYLALTQKWPYGEILWIYWAQSVIIGVSNFFRMISLREFTTEGLKSNGQQVPETPGGKYATAGFFALHYGFFHFVYAIFLAQEMSLGDIPSTHILPLALCIAAFAASHVFSLGYNSNRDFKDKKPNLGTLLFYPYVRIVPMHFIILFGGFVSGFIGARAEWLLIVFFMLMKTVADALMHVIEHALFQAEESPFTLKG